MRTPDEHLSDLEREGFKLDPEFRGLFLITIGQAQKEAWNEAIELAAESATMLRSHGIGVDFIEMIPYAIDKQSILKLKKTI